MQLVTYKTNIRTLPALSRIAPVLNQVVGAANWQFDNQSREKKLTVFSYDQLDECRLVKAIRRAGFRIRSLNGQRAF